MLDFHDLKIQYIIQIRRYIMNTAKRLNITVPEDVADILKGVKTNLLLSLKL